MYLTSTVSAAGFNFSSASTASSIVVVVVVATAGASPVTFAQMGYTLQLLSGLSAGWAECDCPVYRVICASAQQKKGPLPTCHLIVLAATAERPAN